MIWRCAMAKISDFRKHDPKHPYVAKLIGCGHGRLFSEPCPECEIVDLHRRYGSAVNTIKRVRDRLKELGAPIPEGADK